MALDEVYHITLHKLCQPKYTINHCHSSVISLTAKINVLTDRWMCLIDRCMRSPFLSSSSCFASWWVWTDPQTVHSAKKHPIKHLTLIFSQPVCKKLLKKQLSLFRKYRRKLYIMKRKNIINIQMHSNVFLINIKRDPKKIGINCRSCSLKHETSGVRVRLRKRSSCLFVSKQRKTFAFFPPTVKLRRVNAKAYPGISPRLVVFICSTKNDPPPPARREKLQTVFPDFRTPRALEVPNAHLGNTLQLH